MSPASVFPLLLGWVSAAALWFIGPDSAAPLWLLAIVTVIVVCAFGVLGHAEELARRLGDPLGTLVLTLSIVTIEVTLIAAVLLGPGDHATVARDATMSAAMLFIGLFFGSSALVATLRHGPLKLNAEGVSSYVAMLVVFGALAFVVPGLIGTDGAFSPAQTITVIALTAGSYVFFLWQQTGPRAADFQDLRPTPGHAPSSSPVWLHGVFLFLTAAAIIVLSHDMAGLLDTTVPPAASGLIIATIVMLPEGLTTLRAAWFGEIQRVLNLTHGAMVSVVGLTIPTVLTIGLLTGQRIVFAETPTNIALLTVLALLSVTLLGGKKVTPLHALAHLVLGVVYLLSVFS